MHTVELSPKVINSLKRDPAGPKSQRRWFPELRGLGIDLGKSKRSFILKYKSPITDKFRIIAIESYGNDQVITEDDLEDVREDHSALRKKIRASIDPLLEKEEAREAHKQAELAAKLEQNTKGKGKYGKCLYAEPCIR